MLRSGELELLRNKTGATRLGFALLITFLRWKRQFPRSRSDLPDNTIEFVAKQVGVAAGELGFYDWDGRQIKRHRTEIRRVTGFRECGVADADKLTAWLAEGFCRSERRPERVREHLLRRCREERIEPPAVDRIGRIVGSALHQAEQALCLRISGRIPSAVAAHLLTLIEQADDEPAGELDERDSPEVFATIKADPGNISLKTTREEVGKLTAIRTIGVAPTLFAEVAPKVAAAVTPPAGQVRDPTLVGSAQRDPYRHPDVPDTVTHRIAPPTRHRQDPALRCSRRATGRGSWAR